MGFFQEDNGNKSAMRLMCFIALIAAIVFGIFSVTMPGADEPGIALTGMFLTAAFGGKVTQKLAESKTTNNKGTNE